MVNQALPRPYPQSLLSPGKTWAHGLPGNHLHTLSGSPVWRHREQHPRVTTECSQRGWSSLCSESSVKSCQSWWKLVSCRPTCLILLQSLRKQACSKIQGIGTGGSPSVKKKMTLGRMVNSIMISFTLTSLKRHPNPTHTHIFLAMYLCMWSYVNSDLYVVRQSSLNNQKI